MKKTFTFSLLICCILQAFAQNSNDEWGQINVSIANVRTTKGNASELCSQEYMGMPVKILEKDGSWWKIETTDGYNGWMYDEAICPKTPVELSAWRKADRLIVSSKQQIKVYNSPESSSPRSAVTDLVPCDIVEGSLYNSVNGRIEITLPDGRKGWADADAFTDLREWASQPFNSEKILEQAYSLTGTPYLWGGNSVKALDCSGLSKLCYLTNGIFLRRDASMQVETGQALNIDEWPTFQQADLLFFGNPKTGKITHVAIYDADGYYVHSTGYGERVRRNSIDPNSSDRGRGTFLRATRIHGSENTPGITKAINHPWLF